MSPLISTKIIIIKNQKTKKPKKKPSTCEYWHPKRIWILSNFCKTSTSTKSRRWIREKRKKMIKLSEFKHYFKITGRLLSGVNQSQDR